MDSKSDFTDDEDYCDYDYGDDDEYEEISIRREKLSHSANLVYFNRGDEQSSPKLYSFDRASHWCHGPIHRGQLFIYIKTNWNPFYVVLSKSFLRCYKTAADRTPVFCYDLQKSQVRLVPTKQKTSFVTDTISIQLRSNIDLLLKVPHISVLLYWLNAFVKASLPFNTFEDDNRTKMKILQRIHQLSQNARRHVRDLGRRAVDRIVSKCIRQNETYSTPSSARVLMRGYLDVSTDKNNYYRRYVLVDSQGLLHVYRRRKDINRMNNDILLTLPLDSLVLHLPTDSIDHIILHLLDKMTLKSVLSLRGSDIFSMGRVLEVLIKFVGITSTTAQRESQVVPPTPPTRQPPQPSISSQYSSLGDLRTKVAAITVKNGCDDPILTDYVPCAKKTPINTHYALGYENKLLIELKLALNTRNRIQSPQLSQEKQNDQNAFIAFKTMGI